jgi:hypothetical protein
MEIIYHDILDAIEDHVIDAEVAGRTIKKFILTHREFGELKKSFMKRYSREAIPLMDELKKIMGIPVEVQ